MNNFWNKFEKPILALAPMAGVSDSSFRLICRHLGADVVYTEMVSADALYYDSKKTLAMLDFDKKERPIVCQIFGKRPETFPRAAKLVEEAGFNGIDLNFGCPAKKVVAHGGGVTLMRDLKKCHELIKAVIDNTKLPVSVKIRTQIDKVTAIDFVNAVKDLPISAIMIHGRGFKDPFNSPIDFEMIKRVKKNFSGIVLGNGGINQPQDAKIMLEKTGVDGLGLARGLYGRPWLFQQIKDYLSTGDYLKYDPNVKSDLKMIKKIIIRQAKAAYKAKGDHGVVEMRKHLSWYVRGWSNASELRQELVRVKTIQKIDNILNF